MGMDETDTVRQETLRKNHQITVEVHQKGVKGYRGRLRSSSDGFSVLAAKSTEMSTKEQKNEKGGNEKYYHIFDRIVKELETLVKSHIFRRYCQTVSYEKIIKKENLPFF